MNMPPGWEMPTTCGTYMLRQKDGRVLMAVVLDKDVVDMDLECEFWLAELTINQEGH